MNDMNDDRLDLSALDPVRDPVAAFDQRVRRIVDDAMLIRRRNADPMALLASWQRPAIAAAAIIAFLALVPLVRSRRPSPNAAGSPSGATAADILGIPPRVIQLARSRTAPGVVDLAEAFNVEQDHARYVR